MASEDKTKKKAEKKQQKLQKKEAKKLKKEGKVTTDLETEEESGGSKAVVALVSIIIVVVWLAIIALLIKWDVGGFGSSVLYPILKDVPYLNRILPETDEVSGDADSGYDSLADAVAQIKSLETQLADAQQASSDKDSQIADLQSEVSRLSSYEQDQSEFEQIRADFYEKVVFSDQAPDISEYQKYYESIDADNAAELYKEVIQQEEASDEIQDYAATYAAMKPKQAAALLEEMTDNLDLVAQILENMSTDSRAAILDAMDSQVAASITELMAPSE